MIAFSANFSLKANLICDCPAYASADGVNLGHKVYTVFNISGNKLRLITDVVYRYQTIYIKHVLTHAEYDKGAWKK
jgi:mRNA interferase HigB